jgi:precorrin-6A/cobalt-precorrin-6A reductase
MSSLPPQPHQGPIKVLILGGTSEAIALAARLSPHPELTVISSLAGRVAEPRLPEGRVRIGGFGGVDGLIAYLQNEAIGIVIDATHPYAATISRNAEQACKALRLPLIAIARPPWDKVEGDRWHQVPDVSAASACLLLRGRRVFLAIGRQELAPFRLCDDTWFLVRSIDPPEGELPKHAEIILRRGPYKVEEELQLLRDHAIDCVVSKNSGGAATYAKIQAARLLGLSVIMVGRPRKHTLPTVGTVEEAIDQLKSLQDTPNPPQEGC